jgi:hypothetical protein
MHIDPTLDILDGVTVGIGNAFRTFNNETLPAFDTRELPREANARKRRQAKKAQANPRSPNQALDASPDLEGDEELDGPRRKTINLQTYKCHALGDYASTIRRYGSTDSYSTERVSNFKFGPAHLILRLKNALFCQGELAHREAKSHYKRTDRKKFVRQLAQIERRVARIRRIRAKLASSGRLSEEPVPISPQEHHHIGASQNEFQHIGTFLNKNAGDPAIKARQKSGTQTKLR